MCLDAEGDSVAEVTEPLTVHAAVPQSAAIVELWVSTVQLACAAEIPLTMTDVTAPGSDTHHRTWRGQDSLTACASLPASLPDASFPDRKHTVLPGRRSYDAVLLLRTVANWTVARKTAL